jgi:hypothetical protein
MPLGELGLRRSCSRQEAGGGDSTAESLADSVAMVALWDTICASHEACAFVRAARKHAET